MLPVEEVEPPSKRVKTGSNTTDVDHSLPLFTKEDLLESLRFNQMDDRFMNIKPGHAKTCKWLLESAEYLDWMNADKLSEHHGFFWIKGKPGCGKSTLTKFAFMEIRKSSLSTTLLSFFFNARGSNLEKNTIGLYRSLLVQLLEKFPGSEQFWNVPSLTHRPSDGQLKMSREMLKHLLAQAIQILDQHSITVIVDALDECDEDEVRDMTAFFEKLGEDAISNRRTFHVLFSSRHYPHITIQRSIEMKLEDQQGHSQDIDKYLSSELKAGRGKQAEQIRQEIRDRSSGIFMWIILVVQILNKAFDHGKLHTLQKKLQEIPNDLNELFRTILIRDNQNLDEMKLCLQCILFANRPLKREELYFAILSGTEPDELFPFDPEIVSPETMDLFILSSSKGLAEITRSKQSTVQFIHESVKDFLLKGNGLGQVWADLKANSIGMSQNRLKECCSNYITSDITSWLGIDGSLPSASSLKGAELRKKASVQLPFLEYAICNIFAHADVAHAEGVDQEDFVKDFELSNWIQLNNIIERYQVRRVRDMDLLYILAEKNCPSLISILMQDGLCTRRRSGRYGNPIFAAIANDSHQAFEALVRGDSQAHPHRSEFPYPADDICSFLVKHGKPALIHRFISVYDVDITSALENSGTLLSWAAGKGDMKTVELVVSRGADVNAQDEYYGNALQAASVEGQEKVVEILVRRGADVNAQGGDPGNALYAASAAGHKKVVEILVNHGADVNAQGGYYGNALQAASAAGHEEVVKILVSRGADVNTQGGDPGNALYAASVEGHEKVVEILVDHDAHINAQGGYYGNALQAASATGHDEVVKILVSHGADVNTQGGYYGNALQAASATGHEKVVEILVSHGVDINAQGGYYGNALQAASAAGHEKVVEILVSRC